MDDKLDYNEKNFYQLVLVATVSWEFLGPLHAIIRNVFLLPSFQDGKLNSTTSLGVQIVDVQNTPPVFQGSLAAVVSEDTPIGTLVMTVVARDGDRGQPRKIVYDLLENPMDYFLLDAKSGELKTARPLDKEALPSESGLIRLSIRAREVQDGSPLDGPLTSTVATAVVKLLDVNDRSPTFNLKDYYVNVPENTAAGTPLPIELSVADLDVGNNSIFSLRLDDVSEVFDVEPKVVVGASQVSVRVKGTLDYENPNERNLLLLIIAEETETPQKLSSTATIHIQVVDENDNAPKFDSESYSVTVPETANEGHLIATITARDLDSGHFGTEGIRYSLSGTGAEFFEVDSRTGAISVARCQHNVKKRQIDDYEDYDSATTNPEEYRLQEIFESEEASDQYNSYSVTQESPTATTPTDFLGKPPCLDYETQSVYFLSYAVSYLESRQGVL